MTISYSDSAKNYISTGESLPITLNVPAGGTITTFVRLGIGKYSSISDDDSNTYDTPIAADSGTNHTNTHIAAHNCASNAANVITVVPTSSTTIRFVGSCYSSDNVLELDTNNSNSGSSTTTWSSGSVSNSSQPCLLVTSTSTDTNVAGITPDGGPGYIERKEESSRINICDNISTSTGSQQNTGTFTTSENYVCQIIAYVEAAAGGETLLYDTYYRTLLSNGPM